MHTLLCVFPPRVESLHPPVLSESCSQIPLAFKVWFCRNSSSCCWTPRFRSLTWGSVPSFQRVEFCGISFLQFVSHPPSRYGIWFYCDCAPLPSHCVFSFVFGCGISFLVSSNVFLSMIVQQLVVILVFSQEGVRARSSTPPSWFQIFPTLAWLIWRPKTEYNVSSSFPVYPATILRPSVKDFPSEESMKKIRR